MHITDHKLFKIFANPFFWRMKAEEMKRSAELLKVDADKYGEILLENIDNKDFKLSDIPPSVGQVYFAMCGFAIECLFKGVIIGLHPEYTSNGVISGKLTTHDLIELSKMGDLKLNSDEKLFCENTYRYMINFRYPVPKKMEETQYTRISSGDYVQIFEKLHKRTFSLIKGFNMIGHDEDRCPKCSSKNKE